ncbi:unnamed protein product [Psylliodes chrysocephalus]|uniref:Fibrinogen C-terminal domain-containing protein n=1 Tax=Psylliodes chrysocephalus TaxID=3402493 RepID=A0A9P0CUT3_9CUCU|nr:unnamed protein product [Psylliodes chrysocephala]
MLIYYLFIILLSSSFCATDEKIHDANEPDNGPFNFKFTKLIDIRLGGKNFNNVNDIIQSNINEAIGVDNSKKQSPEMYLVNEQHEEQNVRAERSCNTDQNLIINRLDSITGKLQNIQNVCQKSNCESQTVSNIGINSEFCDRLVGLSKLQYCDFFEEKYSKNYSNATKSNIPKSCKEIQENGQNKSGMYQIQSKSSFKPIFVLCDMETKDGGWTVVQKRFDGSENFVREWRDYKFGFGDLKREFWLGLENIYNIVGFEANELLVEITDRDKIKAYAHYKSFGIGPETDGYPLNLLNGFSGDAGDSLGYHSGAKFSTKDMDQDTVPGNCAETYLSGWWYKSCHKSNLNGNYINLALPEQYKFKGLHWEGFRGHEYCHSGSRMLVRPSTPK